MSAAPPWAVNLPAAPITRFAPSPTGFLHIGHVVNAIYTWGLARRYGGTIILRMEDHDRRRCRAEYEQAILEDLEWLGLEPDLGRFSDFSRATPFRQSSNDEAYTSALELLANAGFVYACECSRRDISEEGHPGSDRELRYGGRCRTRGLATTGDRGLRVRMVPGSEQFTDVWAGAQCQDPSRQCGDLLVRDRHGQWTYHFAVSVDDAQQGVNLVIRGKDLLASTGRQRRIAALLGCAPPRLYAHHPLIFDSDGAKLSKRTAATGVRELRVAGWVPAAVLGDAATRVGLLRSGVSIGAADLPELFS